MNPWYIIFATKHSASSCTTSIPDIRKEQWNIDNGIRELFLDATQLCRPKISMQRQVEDWKTWSLHSAEQSPQTQFPRFLQGQPKVQFDQSAFPFF